MNKLKLSNYQIVITILFFIIYTITIQISARPILIDQIKNIPQDIKIDSDWALFWANIVTVTLSVILVIFQSLIYKIIIGFIGTKNNYSIGLNLFLFLSSLLPSFIFIALLTYFNESIRVFENVWINIISIIFSSFIYSFLLWSCSIIEKRKAVIVFFVIGLLNVLIAILKFI
ncbi:hypothetical protein [Staphylococcus kloosii]|jgi:hypothetical protein|uniref:hypothetical protein n=1 Tax=Staphylococcus kloosii TaxID=29384 RepID=UPI00189EC16E|nr:hypothetical protein [Staphylococcus kloosii]MBF7025566.1 hypothetical protein [Staphylococcus kloosii]